MYLKGKDSKVQVILADPQVGHRTFHWLHLFCSSHKFGQWTYFLLLELNVDDILWF